MQVLEECQRRAEKPAERSAARIAREAKRDGEETEKRAGEEAERWKKVTVCMALVGLPVAEAEVLAVVARLFYVRQLRIRAVVSYPCPVVGIH